eukprot:607807-Pelagomonas_calceolata.AAC.1
MTTSLRTGAQAKLSLCPKAANTGQKTEVKSRHLGFYITTLCKLASEQPSTKMSRCCAGERKNKHSAS